MAHVLDNRVRTGNFNVLFAIAGRASGAHILICKTTRADDRRISDSSGDFPSQAARGSAAGNFAFCTQGRAVNGSGRREDNITDRFQAMRRRNPDLFRNLFHALNAKLPLVRMPRSTKLSLPIRTGNSRTPPVRMCLLPEQPFFARLVRYQIFALELLRNSEPLGAF